ncbi:MAG: hypothetical protein AAF604_00680 [Acidobacteriota bacterium]
MAEKPAGRVLFDDRTQLRWFLYYLHEASPRALESLREAKSGYFLEAPFPKPPHLRGEDEYGDELPRGRLDEGWFAQWTKRSHLPDTAQMKQEAEEHLSYSADDDYWIFDPRASGQFFSPKELNEKRSYLTGADTRFQPPPIRRTFEVELPNPLLASLDRKTFEQWKDEQRTALAQAFEEAFETSSPAILSQHPKEDPREEPWRLWFIGHWDGQQSGHRRSVEQQARNLCWLAMKQAGAPYEATPQWTVENLQKGPYRVPQGAVRDYAARSTYKDAVEAAAESVGLPLDRIRSNTRGVSRIK